MLKFNAFCRENNIIDVDLSMILNVSVYQANMLINGVECYSLEQIKTLCLYFGISADAYFI